MHFRKAVGLALFVGGLIWGAGLTAAQDSVLIAYDSPMQGQITPTQPVQMYSFEGKVGDVVTLTLSSDAVLSQSVQPASLQNPFGMPVPLYAGETLADGTQVSRVALRTDGQHTITVQAVDASTSADFTLSLTLSGSTLNDGAQYVRLTPESQTQTLTYSGTAGEQIKLNLQFVMDGAAMMPITGDGQQLPVMKQLPPGASPGTGPGSSVRSLAPGGSPDTAAVPGTASISVSQNGSLLAGAREDPANMMSIDMPKTTLEITIPADGTVEVVVTVSSFPQLPTEVPQVLERQVYVEQVS